MARVHFHSDCPFFAGCENVLANLFNDKQFIESHDISFTYRYTKEYESGLKNRVRSKIRFLPLNLPDISTLKGRFSSGALNSTIKFLIEILLIKYWFVLWNTLILRRALAGERIDIFVINNGGYPGAYSCMSAAFAARLLGIEKVVYIVNNIPAPYTTIRRLIDWPFDRLVVRRVSRFVTGSDHTRLKLASALKVSESKTQTINNGIDREITEDREAARKRLGAGENDFVVGVVAVLEKRKGHIYLFEALSALAADDGPAALPLTLLCFEGGAPEEANLIRAARDLGIESRVRFSGSEGNVFNFINAVDALVLPSIEKEDFPYVIIEAMSLGKPIAATRVAGIPEQIEDGKSGLLLPPGNAAALANALRKLRDEPVTAAALGRAARLRYEEKLTVERAVASYSRLLESL